MPVTSPRWAGVAFVAALVAIACAAFAPLFHPGAWFMWDVPDQYWPDLQYLCGALHDGVWPLWNPYDRAGYPFHADPQSGLHYPLNWAICAVGGAHPSLAWAQWRVVFHFVLGGCAMGAFLRTLKLDWGPTLLGAVAFMLAPYPRRMWEVNLSYTLAYMPLLWWSLERLAQRPDARRAAVVALVAALATSVGSPPSLYFTALAAGAYALARCGPRRETWPWLALAGVLAGTMCAVMVLPTAALSRVSVQQAHDFASISAGAYPPRSLYGLVWPDRMLWYLGFPALALAVWGALSPRSPLTRAQRWCFGGLMVFAALMMLGAYTPLYRLMYHVLPGVRAFRMPPRYSAILGAACAVLAAGGASALPRARWTSWLTVPVFLASVWPTLMPGRDVQTTPVPGGRNRHEALRARMGDVSSAWRVHDEFGLGLRAGTRYAMRDLRGYQDPLQLGRYAKIMGELAEHPHLLEQFNVRYLLRGPHFLHGTGHHYLPAGSEPVVARDLGDGLWETRAPLPAAYWTDRVAVLDDREAVLERLRREAPTAVCLLERDDGGVTVSGAAGAVAAGAVVAATQVAVTREGVTLRIDAPRDGWLVVQEAYHPGWTATVDGRAVEVRRANYMVRAVPLRVGRHAVVMRYQPTGQRALTALALLGVAVTLVLVGRGTRRRRTWCALERHQEGG